MAEEQDPILNFKPNNKNSGATTLGEGYEMNPTKSLADNIRAKYPPNSSPSLQGGKRPSAMSAPIHAFKSNNDHKVAFKEYTVNPDEIYKQMGDGTFKATVDNYIGGTDNYERLALQQTTGEKWAHGLKKFALKTSTAVLGGTVGSVSGLFNAMQEGSLSTVYTDDFNKMLDVYNEKLDYELPNYVSRQERDLGFFESMGTANFWANDFLSGISFTVGTIVSEGIWAAATGGTSLIARGAMGGVARWSTKMLGKTKALSGLQQWKAPAKSLINKTTANKFDDAVDAFTRNNPMNKIGTGKADEALRIGTPNAAGASDNLMGAGALNKNAAKWGARVSQGLNQARFIYTSAGYEAGVEARHYIKEAEEEYVRNYQEEYGRKPSPQELAKAKVAIADGANAVFLANVALVGSSNMAIFGKLVMGKSVKPAVSNSAIKRQLFGVGYDVKDGAATAIKATKKQKIAGKAYSILRAPVIEGVWEEGGQSVAAKSVKDYILGGLDPNASQENLGMMDSLMEGFKQTYGTKEGRKEVGLGMLIGFFGGAVATGGRFNEISSERKGVEQAVDFRNSVQNKDVLASFIMTERMKANNRILKANLAQEEAAARGDMTGEFMSEQQAILASIERDVALQGREQGIEDFKAYLNTVKDADLAKDLGIKESEVGEWKSSKLQEYTDLSESYKDNEEYVRAMLGNTPIAGVANTDAVIKALAYNLTIGEQSKQFTSKLAEDIKTAIAGEFAMDDVTGALNVDQALSQASQKSVKAYQTLSNKVKQLENQRAEIEAQMMSAQYGDAQDPAARTAKLNRLQKKLVETDKRMSELQQKKDVAYRALGIKEELITEADVHAQAENMQALKETVEGYKETNPQLYTTLTKLFTEYQKAKSNTMSFQQLMKEFSDPKMRVSTLNGWLSGIINKGKTLDESTQEFFMSQIEQYQKNMLQNKAEQDAIKDTTQTDQEEETEETSEPATVTNETEGDEMKVEETTTTPKTPSAAEQLKKKVEDIMKDSEYTTAYIGTEYSEAVKNRPSQEDMNRYEQLLRKINAKYFPQFRQLLQAPEGYYKKNKIDTGLSEAELSELRKLQVKLSNWQVLEGSLDGEKNSIADYLQVIEQFESAAERAGTKQDLTPKDYAEMKTATEEASQEYDIASPVQSPDQVLAAVRDVEGERFYDLSHIDATSLPRLFPEGKLEVLIKGESKSLSSFTKGRLESILKKKGQEFLLTTANGNVKITVDKMSRLRINKKDFDSILGNSNIAIVKYGSTNYYDIYERLENGDLIPLKGDFDYKSELEGETININPEVVNNVTEGQIVITRVNLNDVYNAQLVKKYKAKENPTEADYNELMNNLHIYITDTEGKLIGSLRAGSEGLKDNTTTKNMLELRRKAADMIKEGKYEGQFFSLNEAMPIKNTLIGSPNFVIRENNGKLQPQPIDFTDTALEKVEDVGYLQGETLTLRNMDAEKVIKTFLPKNPSEKVPVAILRVNGKDVAFPLTLKAEGVNKAARYDEIMNTDLPSVKKAAKVNELLLESGLTPADFANATQEELREALTEIKEFANVSDWIDGYDLNSLKNEAQIAIDLDNKPFNISKVILDLDKTRTTSTKEQATWRYENLNDRDSAITKALQAYARAIAISKGDYVDKRGEPVENAFTDILDDKTVEEGFNFDQHNNLMYNHNVKILKELTSIRSIPNTIRRVHNPSFFDDLQALLTELDDVRAMKADNSKIKNKKVNNEVNEANTACKK